MNNRREFLFGTGAMAMAATVPAVTVRQQADTPPRATRERWLDWVERVSEPLLIALSRRELRRLMPVEAVQGHEQERAVGTHLEALGRLATGLAPWLELEPSAGESARETALRTRYRGLLQKGIASAVDPSSPDYMRFGASSQTIVDASFLALAVLRAPKQLLGTMTTATREHLTAALVAERVVLTGLNNWVLFAAMDEALLCKLGAPWDRMRVAYALNELHAWYVGDGTYGDGPAYHADFYNSYVMHPYLLMLMEQLGDEAAAWKAMRADIVHRASRYAGIQERMVGPDGAFPVLGRSICYRAGAFHLLADASLRGILPDHLSPAQVRGALTATQSRTLDAPGTFDAQGWLRIGLAGHQPGLAETYISTGSLYLCSAAWLPLGLPPSHAFWSAPDQDWTQKAVWSGHDAVADHALG
jgi:hypothetical protein